MWEKGGIIYALHRSIQRTHHVHVQWLCKTVIHYAAINAWRDRSRRRQKEISLEYLTEEKFYPLGTTDEYFEAPHEEHPITICGQAVILTNGKLAAVLLSLPQKTGKSFPLFFKMGLQWVKNSKPKYDEAGIEMKVVSILNKIMITRDLKY